METQPQYVYVPVPPARGHSGLGIASFILALVTGLLLFGLIMVAGAIGMQNPEAMEGEKPMVMAIGLLFLSLLAMCLVGAVLGLAGLFQRDRHKVFPILGLVLNLGILLGVAALVIIGTVAG